MVVLWSYRRYKQLANDLWITAKDPSKQSFCRHPFLIFIYFLLYSYAVRTNCETITLSVTQRHVELHFSHLLVISSWVILAACNHVFGQLSDYYCPTSFCFFLSFFFFFLQVAQSDRNQSRERDHRGSKSKERERSSRDGELPSSSSQTVARDRAIKQKRREIDEVKEVSLHKHTCTLGAGLVINRLRKRGDKRGRD